MRFLRVQRMLLSTVGQEKGNPMNDLLRSSGRLVGLAGLLVCGVAVAWRLLGNYYLASFDVGTWLQAGTSAVVIGCFLLLLVRAGPP